MGADGFNSVINLGIIHREVACDMCTVNINSNFMQNIKMIRYFIPICSNDAPNHKNIPTRDKTPWQKFFFSPLGILNSLKISIVNKYKKWLLKGERCNGTLVYLSFFRNTLQLNTIEYNA